MIGKYLCIDSLSHVTIYGKYKKNQQNPPRVFKFPP